MQYQRLLLGRRNACVFRTWSTAATVVTATIPIAASVPIQVQSDIRRSTGASCPDGLRRETSQGRRAGIRPSTSVDAAAAGILLRLRASRAPAAPTRRGA